MKTIASRKSVFIVEDHPVFCDGLRALFNHDPALHVCGTATSAGEALRRVRRHKPDVLIVDIGLPDKSGFELITEVLAFEPNTRILVVSAGDEMVQAKRALRAGAKGYVMKHEGPQRLLESVHQVLEDRTSVSPQVSNQILRSVHHARGSVNPLDRLSRREREVLHLIGQGRSSADIAAQLRISRKTVDSYRGTIQQKLGLNGAHQLICYAVRAETF